MSESCQESKVERLMTHHATERYTRSKLTIPGPLPEVTRLFRQGERVLLVVSCNRDPAAKDLC